MKRAQVGLLFFFESFRGLQFGLSSHLVHKASGSHTKMGSRDLSQIAVQHDQKWLNTYALFLWRACMPLENEKVLLFIFVDACSLCKEGITVWPFLAMLNAIFYQFAVGNASSSGHKCLAGILNGDFVL
jgi:hypothetical protein